MEFPTPAAGSHPPGGVTARGVAGREFFRLSRSGRRFHTIINFAHGPPFTMLLSIRRSDVRTGTRNTCNQWNLTQHFLIAMPAMVDPNFSKTLTYICDQTRGALGLVVNRP